MSQATNAFHRRPRSTGAGWRSSLCALLLAVAAPMADANVMYEVWKDTLAREEVQRQDAERALLEMEAAREQQREDQLRARLAACGACAERAALEGEVAAIDRRRAASRQALCRSIEAVDRMTAGESFGDGLLVRLSRLLGIEAMCEAPGAQARRAAKTQAFHRRWAETLNDIEADRPLAYVQLSILVREGEGDIPVAERRRAACTVYLSAARRGSRPATYQLLADCLGAEASETDRQRIHDLALACADRGDRGCLSGLSMFPQAQARIVECSRQGVAECSAALSAQHDPGRRPQTLPAGFRPDAAERIRLLELAVVQGLTGATPQLRRLRLDAGALNLALHPGRYLLSGRIDRQGRPGSSGNYHGDCEITPAEPQQYRVDCRIASRLRSTIAVVRGDRMRMAVDGFELEFRLREDVAMPSGEVAMLSGHSADGQLTESYMVRIALPAGGMGARPDVGGTTDGGQATPRMAPASPRSPAERRCEAARRLAERYRDMATRDARYGPQARATAEDEARICAAR